MKSFFSDYSDFFRFIGWGLILGCVTFMCFRRKLKNIFISDKEISELRAANQISTVKVSLPKISTKTILLTVIIGGFLFNQFIMWRVGSPGVLGKLFSVSVSVTRKNAK